MTPWMWTIHCSIPLTEKPSSAIFDQKQGTDHVKSIISNSNLKDTYIKFYLSIQNFFVDLDHVDLKVAEHSF